jgi:hypothetical protein
VDLVARRRGQFNFIGARHINDEADRNRGEIAPKLATIGYVLSARFMSFLGAGL